MSDGAVRNGYTVRVLNKQPNDRKVALSVDGAPNLQVQIINGKGGQGATVGPDQTLELRVAVTAPAGFVPAQPVDVVFTVKDEASATTATHKDHFFPK
jgi:polyferredoxin